MPVMTKDFEPTPERVAALKQAEGAAASRAQLEPLKEKTWGQLTAAEKDAVLKAIAINLGIVAPDDEMIPRALEAKARLPIGTVPAPTRK